MPRVHCPEPVAVTGEANGGSAVVRPAEAFTAFRVQQRDARRADRRNNQRLIRENVIDGAVGRVDGGQRRGV